MRLEVETWRRGKSRWLVLATLAVAGCASFQTPNPPVETGWMAATFQQLAPDLLKFACLSDEAYGQAAPGSTCARLVPESSIHRFTAPVPHWNDTVGYIIVDDDRRRQQYLAIRGTDPGRLSDLLIDADLQKPAADDNLGVRMHTGFHDYAQAVIDSLRQNPFFHPSYKTTFAGHSLGGAAVLIVALELHFAPDHPLDVDRVFTYGQPRVFDNNGAIAWPVFAQHVYRVVSCADPVPLVPRGDGPLDNLFDLRLSGTTAQDYQHLGQEILLMDDGAFWISGGVEVWANYHQALNTMLFALVHDQPIDHGIGNYEGRIEQASAGTSAGPRNPSIPDPPCTPAGGVR